MIDTKEVEKKKGLLRPASNKKYWRLVCDTCGFKITDWHEYNKNDYLKDIDTIVCNLCSSNVKTNVSRAMTKLSLKSDPLKSLSDRGYGEFYGG